MFNAAVIFTHNLVRNCSQLVNSVRPIDMSIMVFVLDVRQFYAQSSHQQVKHLSGRDFVPVTHGWVWGFESRRKLFSFGKIIQNDSVLRFELIILIHINRQWKSCIGIMPPPYKQHRSWKIDRLDKVARPTGNGKFWWQTHSCLQPAFENWLYDWFYKCNLHCFWRV